MREVNHRSKNLLSVVQAIARQTAKEASPRDFLELFSQRLSGLAANQDLLVKSEWKDVPVKEVIEAQLSPLGDILGSRVSVSGPDIDVTPAASQAFALAIHELATNALKYGALSVATGHINVSWSVQSGEFQLTWTEREGPTVTPPERRGFGSTVISQLTKSALKGSSELEFGSDGVTWRLHCPVSAISGSSAPETLRTPFSTTAIAGHSKGKFDLFHREA
jgi:two-component sensor histidine kinase